MGRFIEYMVCKNGWDMEVENWGEQGEEQKQRGLEIGRKEEGREIF